MPPQRPTLLVVEDNAELRRVLLLALRNQDYQVQEAESGAEALAHIRRQSPDAIVLDLGLPDVSGFELISRIRSEHELPILVLSANADEEQQVRALDAGASDCVTKPFRERELLARIRVLLRRPASTETELDCITLGDLRLEPTKRRLFVANAEVKLTRTEFDLLEALARKANRVVTHGHLLQAVWGANHAHEVHYLRVYVKLLRQKIEENPAQPKRLLTALGLGYRLITAEAAG